jgi:lipopolysaccharide heptosyltransferase I
MSQSDTRFLIIRLSSIGDIVHALPAVSALAATFPHAEIRWLVDARYASLLEGNPFLRRIVKLDTLEWRNDLLSPVTLEQIVRTGGELRADGFDAAVDFQGLLKSAILARISRSRARVGFAEPWLREPTAGVFYTDRVSPRDRRHVIEMNLALVERLGARIPDPDHWQFPLPRSETVDRDVGQKLDSLQAREFVVMNPGGGWKSKCWAPEHYAELIRRLEPEIPWKILLTGSAEEEPAISEIERRAHSPRAVYFPSTIIQYISLIRRAKLFVGGDTGPMHLAAAARTPVVALFGLSDRLNTPERNGPFSPKDITVRPPVMESGGTREDEAGYLQGISVECVLAGVRKRLIKAYG